MTVKERIDSLFIENKILEERLKLLRELIIKNVVVKDKTLYFREDFRAKRLLNIIDGSREEGIIEQNGYYR